nr:allatotropin [Carausius morosus]
MRAPCTAHVALLVLLAASVLCAVAGAGSYPSQRSKPRSIRGFKNVALSTARGFGKRDGSSPADLLDQDKPDRLVVDSLPVDWFVEELRTNPELARIIVHKFVDLDQDGELSAEELLRPVY